MEETGSRPILGPRLVTTSNPDRLLKTPPANTIVLGVGALAYEGGPNIHSAHDIQ